MYIMMQYFILHKKENKCITHECSRQISLWKNIYDSNNNLEASILLLKVILDLLYKLYLNG